jgi:hypothetical protein
MSTISSSWVRRICAESCEPMLATTTTSEPTGPWLKMRQSLAPFSGPEALGHARSLADFITTTTGFRISVHTACRSSFSCQATYSRSVEDSPEGPLSWSDLRGRARERRRGGSPRSARRLLRQPILTSRIKINARTKTAISTTIIKRPCQPRGRRSCSELIFQNYPHFRRLGEGFVAQALHSSCVDI